MLTKTDLHFLQMASLQGAQKDSDASKDNDKPHKTTRGAILAEDNKIISQGTSQHLGGDMVDGQEKYAATINAEIVAVGAALEKGVAPLSRVTIYVTDCPNWYTFKTLVSLGVKRIVHYGIAPERISHYALELGIQLISVG